MDGSGLKLEKIGHKLRVPKILKKFVMVCPLFVVALQKPFL